MRKKIIILVILGLILFFTTWTQNGEKKIKETVSVLNIEIPVRVFYKGNPVDNLTKNDFSLIANGRERDIIGFNIVRKQIQVQELGLESEKEYPPRYFVLAANVTNFSPEIKKGVEQVIDRIIRDRDAMLVFINNKTLLLKNFRNKSEIKEKIFDMITRESILAKKKMLLYFKQLESNIDLVRFLINLRQISRGKSAVDTKQDIYFISDFLRKYLTIWRDYKNKYLLPDVRTYLLFSKHLQRVPVEKWVISFYQQELFPRIVMKGEIMRIIQNLIYDWQASSNSEIVTFSRLISKQISDIRKEMKVAMGFPTEEITKIFTKVGATFHTVFINTKIPVFSKDIEYKRISTDLENNLRGLTKKTGGVLVTTKDLKVAVDKIVKKQDIFYVLTYSPKEGEKLEKLKIKIHKRKHKLSYDDNVRTEFTKKPARGIIVDKNTEIKIEDIKFTDKQLSFKVSEFAVQKTTQGVLGSVNVRIRINNMQDNPVFDKNNNLTTRSSEAKVSLGFKWLVKGRYEIVIEAKDNNTGKMASDFIQVKIK